MSLFGNFDVAKLASQLGGFSITDDPEIQYAPKDFGYSNYGISEEGYSGRPPSGYAGGPQNGADEYKREHPNAWGTSDPERALHHEGGDSSGTYAGYGAAVGYAYGSQQPPYPSDSPHPQPQRYGDQSAPYPTDSPHHASSPYPPPPHGYGRPPSPRLPEGWTKRFDEHSGRWYYVNMATNTTQWEPPAAPSPYGEQPRYEGHSPQPGYGGHSPQPGYGGHSPQPGYGEYAAAATAAGAVAGASAGYYAGQQYEQSQHQQQRYEPGQSYGQSHGQQSYGQGYEQSYAGEGEKKKKKKSSNGNMLLGVAGGLAVGAIGGALIANALGSDSDSDHEHHRRHDDDDGSSSSGSEDHYRELAYERDESDRESLREARREYEGAREEACGSDASSSDREDLREAREEYEEELEEYYGD